MSRRKRDSQAILRTIERSEQRSSLFWWMVERHDEILQASERQRISWPAFCTEAAKRGLTDTRGRPPSEGNARETWRQARIAVANARKAEAAKPPPRVGAVYPSRIPKDWRPTVVPPIAPSSGPAGSGLPAVVAKPGMPARAPAVDPPLTEEEAARVEAALDQVREQLRDKDWYLNPFPPKRRAD